MIFHTQLQLSRKQQNSLLCVGLDPDPPKLPATIARSPAGVLDFCKAIVAATAEHVAAFKPQIAGFAALRAERSLEQLVVYIRLNYPNIPVILDAKRGDIGNTAKQYAVEAFERYNAHAVTLSPFMGFESLEPFLAYADRGIFLLCRTSNPGADALQQLRLHNGLALFEYIAQLISQTWQADAAQLGYSQALGLVTGATNPAALASVRRLAPTAPLLIPGVGAQGGDLPATVAAALGRDASGKAAETGSIIVNSSRAILYASSGKDFDQAAQKAAAATQAALNQAWTQAVAQ